jgi:hypothetical protein
MREANRLCPSWIDLHRLTEVNSFTARGWLRIQSDNVILLFQCIYFVILAFLNAKAAHNRVSVDRFAMNALLTVCIESNGFVSEEQSQGCRAECLRDCFQARHQHLNIATISFLTTFTPLQLPQSWIPTQ